MMEECQLTCVKQTVDVISQLDKKISDDIVINEERIFESPKLW